MATQRHPSKSKAREMLHNPPNGKKLSDKQRKYFGWLASKQMGGEIDPNGYLESNLDNYTDQKIIPGGNITTEGMAFPIMANGQPLYPNTGEYQFDTPYVVEQPMMQQGGQYRFQLGGGVNYENTNEFNNNHLNKGKNYDKNQWDMYDNASYFIEQGINPLQARDGLGQSFITNHGQAGRDAITGISIFNQDPSNRALSPEERLRKFYSTTNSNPQLEQLRIMGASTNDPYGAYKRSNNVISQGQYIAQDLLANRPAFWQGGQYRF